MKSGQTTKGKAAPVKFLAQIYFIYTDS